MRQPADAVADSESSSSQSHYQLPIEVLIINIMHCFGVRAALATLALVSNVSKVDPVSPVTKESFLDALGEVHDYMDSDEYSTVLGGAASYLEQCKKPKNKINWIIATKIKENDLAQMASESKIRAKFEDAYSVRITKPCEKVLSLNKRYLSFIMKYPEEAAKWEFSDRPLTGLWYKSVDICHQEDMEKAFKEFNSLSKEVRKNLRKNFKFMK